MENLQSNIKEWEMKALDLSQRLAQFNRLKGKVDRLKTLYDRLTNSLKEVGVSQVVDGADQVSIMEMATIPQSVRPGLLKSLLIGLGCGALAGIAILLLLDRIDDRMASFGEFQNHFSENVLGQIPREKTKGKVTLLQPDDARHIFAESYRNIRSSIFFMPYDGPRPKTLLITSAVPNEGKSTISANLAITFALSGARTLLIDGDLRRGASVKRSISHRDRLLRSPEGRSELAGSDRADRLPKPLRPPARQDPLATERAPAPRFDRSPPAGDLQSLRLHHHRQLAGLAADDTTSLAPKIDATLFVVRLSYTSARLTKKSLELLYNRQVNVPGVILNYVDTSLPEYYYYQYSEYYNTPVPDEDRHGVAALQKNSKRANAS
jgi:Mrp family chromosome partitioning ATPase